MTRLQTVVPDGAWGGGDSEGRVDGDAWTAEVQRAAAQVGYACGAMQATVCGYVIAILDAPQTDLPRFTGLGECVYDPAARSILVTAFPAARYAGRPWLRAAIVCTALVAIAAAMWDSAS